MEAIVCRMKTGRVCSSELDQRSEHMANSLMNQLDADKDGKLSWDEFHKGITDLAQQRDSRVWPYVGSMVMVGVILHTRNKTRYNTFHLQFAKKLKTLHTT